MKFRNFCKWVRLPFSCNRSQFSVFFLFVECKYSCFLSFVKRKPFPLKTLHVVLLFLFMQNKSPSQMAPYSIVHSFWLGISECFSLVPSRELYFLGGYKHFNRTDVNSLLLSEQRGTELMETGNHGWKRVRLFLSSFSLMAGPVGGWQVAVPRCAPAWLRGSVGVACNSCDGRVPLCL